MSPTLVYGELGLTVGTQRLVVGEGAGSAGEEMGRSEGDWPPTVAGGLPSARPLGG